MDDLAGDQIVSEHKYSKIPILIVEDHHSVAPFIRHNISSGHLAKSANTVIRFDSHPALQVPDFFRGSGCVNSGLSTRDFTDNNWLLQFCHEGLFQNVVWVNPPWSMHLIKNQTNYVRIGKCGKERLLKVFANEVYFVAESNFHPRNSMVDTKDIVFDTVPSDGESRIEKILEKNHEKPIVLDINLSFFSTLNRVQLMHPEVDLYYRLARMFEYFPPDQRMAESDLRVAHMTRCLQLSELKNLFDYLNEHSVMAPIPPEGPGLRYHLVEDLYDAFQQTSPRINPDWAEIFNAGLNTNEYTVPPTHISSNDELDCMFIRFEKFLEKFKEPPSIITIARSSVLGCTPADQVGFIQEKVFRILNEKFPCDEPILDYPPSSPGPSVPHERSNLPVIPVDPALMDIEARDNIFRVEEKDEDDEEDEEDEDQEKPVA